MGGRGVRKSHFAEEIASDTQTHGRVVVTWTWESRPCSGLRASPRIPGEVEAALALGCPEWPESGSGMWLPQPHGLAGSDTGVLEEDSGTTGHKKRPRLQTRVPPHQGGLGHGGQGWGLRRSPRLRSRTLPGSRSQLKPACRRGSGSRVSPPAPGPRARPPRLARAQPHPAPGPALPRAPASSP